MDASDSIGGLRLVWADFPTHLSLTKSPPVVPRWNFFSEDLVEAAFTLATEFLLPDGTMVCTLRAEHLGHACKEAEACNFKLDRTLYMQLPQNMFLLRDDGAEGVSMLIIAIFIRNSSSSTSRPLYDRHSGDIAANTEGFEADEDIIQEVKLGEGTQPFTLDIRKNPIRYTAERSEAFGRWLLGTFTHQGDSVLDCFAGTGSLARTSKALSRHCISVEVDEGCYNSCINPILHCPADIGQHYFHGDVSEYIAQQQRQQDRDTSHVPIHHQHPHHDRDTSLPPIYHGHPQQDRGTSHIPIYHGQPQYHIPMSPTRSTGSSWAPGVPFRPRLPPLPPPHGPHPVPPRPLLPQPLNPLNLPPHMQRHM